MSRCSRTNASHCPASHGPEIGCGVTTSPGSSPSSTPGTASSSRWLHSSATIQNESGPRRRGSATSGAACPGFHVSATDCSIDLPRWMCSPAKRWPRRSASAAAHSRTRGRGRGRGSGRDRDDNGGAPGRGRTPVRCSEPGETSRPRRPPSPSSSACRRRPRRLRTRARWRPSPSCRPFPSSRSSALRRGRRARG